MTAHFGTFRRNVQCRVPQDHVVRSQAIWINRLPRNILKALAAGYSSIQFGNAAMLVEVLSSSVAALVVLWSMWLFGRKKTSYKDCHVVVLGGSTGIGLAIAKQLISRGAHITLVARRQAVLETATNELAQHAQTGDHRPKVYVCSIDITDAAQV